MYISCQRRFETHQVVEVDRGKGTRLGNERAKFALTSVYWETAEWDICFIVVFTITEPAVNFIWDDREPNILIGGAEEDQRFLLVCGVTDGCECGHFEGCMSL